MLAENQTAMRIYVLNDDLSYGKTRRDFPPVSKNSFTEWDFGNGLLNGTTQQINRQKSALNQTILFIDAEQKMAFFDDRHDGLNTTTLKSCTCRDFNLAGNYPRKKFFPCKHIYRLCFELGLMIPTHFDHRMRMQMLPKLTWEERLQQTIQTLQNYPKDETRWGQWNEQIHRDQYQIRRQLRAFQIVQNSPIEVANFAEGIVGDYETNLKACSCMDFLDRRIPCKHIYCVAILSNESLPVTLQDFIEQQHDDIDLAASVIEQRITL
jgi:hypothetical protein